MNPLAQARRQHQKRVGGSRAMTRRAALGLIGASAAAISSLPVCAEDTRRRAGRMGVEMHSYSFNWKVAKEDPTRGRFSDAVGFLEYAHRLGAGGVQAPLGRPDLGFSHRVRGKADEYGMYFEAQFQLPVDDADAQRFEADARAAREAGATVFRAACLSTRRYETFKSAEEFRDFKERSWRSIVLAEPILRRHRLKIAIENHKDWLVPELLEILRRLNSEWVGVCVDTGNNIALLEDPAEVMEAFAPFAVSTHVKDMGLQECAEGFLLSEVPLGKGFVNLKEGLGLMRKANPAIRFNLEMITRDPLRIPCLTEQYWTTFPGAPASRLAAAISRVKENLPRQPLPRTSGLTLERHLAYEDANVRESLRHAEEHLAI